jgi:hypothetical protein
MGSFYRKGATGDIPFFPYHSQRNFIMFSFDFEKVHNVMERLGWTWADGTVPSVDRLQKLADRLLWDCYLAQEDPWRISTGGFTAEKGEGLLRLYFSLEECDTWGIGTVEEVEEFLDEQI